MTGRLPERADPAAGGPCARNAASTVREKSVFSILMRPFRRRRAPARSPRVSVVMAVYNGAADVGSAIQSMLDQTFGDFEFIIVDDASTDHSMEIIGRFADRRIRIIRNQRNLGLASSLNRGIREARGEYIARMDCDDFSMRKRLAVQVQYMDAHPDIAVCGSYVRAQGYRSGRWIVPCDHDQIRARFIFNNCIAHPSVLMRKAHLDQLGGPYEEGRRRVEDYELWFRMSTRFMFANIPKVLLRYQTYDIRTLDKHKDVIAAGNVIRRRLLQDLMGPVSEADLDLHMRVSRARRNDSLDFIHAAGQWLNRLLEANDRRGIYERASFGRALAIRWWRVCKASTELGPVSRRLYWEHALSSLYDPSVIQRLGFLLRSRIYSRDESLYPVLRDGLHYYGTEAPSAPAGSAVAVPNTLEATP